MSGTTVERALLIPLDPSGKHAQMDRKIPVHFNPETLKLTRTVTVEADTKSKGSSSQAAQQASDSGANLSFDLVFDTTDVFETQQDAADVTKVTGKIVAAFVNPPSPDGTPPDKPIPANPCLFVWGTFQFTGLFKSYSETLEFFSASGVPLRAAVSISLQENRYKIDNIPARQPGTAQPLPAGSSIAPAMAGAGLDPTDWRGTAMANGLETPRFSVSASIDVSAGASFSATASASAGAGFSVGASADLGTTIPGAFSATVSIGFGAGTSAATDPTASFG